MVIGQPGARGRHVQNHVSLVRLLVQGHVTIQLPLMVGRFVKEPMEKRRTVQWAHAQVSCIVLLGFYTVSK